MYKSKPSLESFVIAFFALFFVIVSVYAVFHPTAIIKGKTSDKDTPVVFLGMFGFIFSAVLFSLLNKRAATITVGPDFISVRYFIKSIRFEFTQIRSIGLFARRDGGIFDSEGKLNGIEIISISGRCYFFPERYIGNKAILKQKLEDFCVENKIELIPFTDINLKSGSYTNIGRKVFAGNYLISSNGVICFGLIVFIWSMPLWVQINKTNNPPYLFLYVFSFLWIVIFSIQSNYFIGENNKLIVKNHLAFWKNKQFDLEDILCATFETRQKTSTSLRIVFKDYSSKRYFAGSLRKRHWEALKDHLESNGIPVIADILF